MKQTQGHNIVRARCQQLYWHLVRSSFARFEELMETDILGRLQSSIFSEIKFEGKSPSFYYPEPVGEVFEGWIMLLLTFKLQRRGSAAP